MKIHIIMHESFEAPAAIEDWARSRHHEISYTRLFDGDVLPEQPDLDFLVVMGGPQSPDTTPKESPHFNAKREVDFIKQTIDADKILIGVCLGAQLIGEALGANYDHSPNREIGVFPVSLTEDGKKDHIVGKFPEKFLVGHWHGDMPGLTDDSKILAISDGCPRQIVRYSPKIYGFQCHFEFTPEAVEDLIKHSTAELEQYKDLPYVESPAELQQHDYSEMNKLLFEFLDTLTGATA